MKIAITGGAGFVGSNLAIRFKQDHPAAEIIALDNLYRPGSELNLPRLDEQGITFIKGDVRNPSDIAKLGEVDVLLDCAAEPSVLAGHGSDRDDKARYVIDTNFLGTVNCLEHLRNFGGRIIFLSSSRVYSMAALREIPLPDKNGRFNPDTGAVGPGWSEAGVNENFSAAGSRTLYGASKLAAEMMIEEYAEMYGIEAVIYRSGVIAGPWQMGKVEQGVFTFWMARHVFGGALNYIGYGGTGRQVRDILHIDDLADLVASRLTDIGNHKGYIFNVGGGAKNAVSLGELTQLCQDISGNQLDIGSVIKERPNDIPWYVTDNSKILQTGGWSPQRGTKAILTDIHHWLVEHQATLESLFTGELK
tara:strand:- start:718 stop:1803 length:1086 start_codon:yes stop_codon:yes gene_type:complete